MTMGQCLVEPVRTGGTITVIKMYFGEQTGEPTVSSFQNAVSQIQCDSTPGSDDAK